MNDAAKARESAGPFRDPDAFWNLLSGSCAKLAEKIAGTRLVLPQLLTLVGVPVFFVGLMQPIREAGSLLPQIFFGGLVRRFPRRKWFWTGAALVQALSVAAIFLIAVRTSSIGPFAAGVLVLCSLALFSLASGIASVAFKDVLAKTVARGRRGALLGARATLGGFLGLAAGFVIVAYLRRFDEEGGSAFELAFLFGPAVLFWVLAALSFAAIREGPSDTQEEGSALEDALHGLRFLREGDFLLFLGARGLLAAVPLAIPFFVLEITGARPSPRSLGLPIVMISLAEILSGPVWGRLSDRDSARAMFLGGALFVCSVFVVLFAPQPAGVWRPYLFQPGLFFLLGLGYGGIRLGRKTYIVDAAPARFRSLFVAVANTCIGLIIFAWGGLSVVAEILSPGSILFVLGLAGAAGTGASLLLKDPVDFCARLK